MRDIDPRITTLTYKFIGLCNKLMPEHKERSGSDWFQALFRMLDQLHTSKSPIFSERWDTFQKDKESHKMLYPTRFSDHADMSIRTHFPMIVASNYDKCAEIVERLRLLLV